MLRLFIFCVGLLSGPGPIEFGNDAPHIRNVDGANVAIPGRGQFDDDGGGTPAGIHHGAARSRSSIGKSAPDHSRDFPSLPTSGIFIHGPGRRGTAASDGRHLGRDIPGSYDNPTRNFRDDRIFSSNPATPSASRRQPWPAVFFTPLPTRPDTDLISTTEPRNHDERRCAETESGGIAPGVIGVSIDVTPSAIAELPGTEPARTGGLAPGAPPPER